MTTLKCDRLKCGNNDGVGNCVSPEVELVSDTPTYPVFDCMTRDENDEEDD